MRAGLCTKGVYSFCRALACCALTLPALAVNNSLGVRELNYFLLTRNRGLFCPLPCSTGFWYDCNFFVTQNYILTVSSQSFNFYQAPLAVSHFVFSLRENHVTSRDGAVLFLGWLMCCRSPEYSGFCTYEWPAHVNVLFCPDYHSFPTSLLCSKCSRSSRESHFPENSFPVALGDHS